MSIVTLFLGCSAACLLSVCLQMTCVLLALSQGGFCGVLLFVLCGSQLLMSFL